MNRRDIEDEDARDQRERDLFLEDEWYKDPHDNDFDETNDKPSKDDD